MRPKVNCDRRYFTHILLDRADEVTERGGGVDDTAKVKGLVFAIGQKRTCACALPMSAFDLKWTSLADLFYLRSVLGNDDVSATAAMPLAFRKESRANVRT